jgi:oligoendopeptidase F
MKFNDMRYTRVDLEELGKQFDALTEKVRNATDSDTVLEAFHEQEKLSVHLQTMASLAFVRSTIDTRDKFYEAEQEFYDLNLPAFQEHSQNLMLAFYESPYRKAVSDLVGELMFKNLEIELKTFSPAVIDLLGRENKLVSDYQKAERIGIKFEDMRIYDDVFSFREGNPKPLGTPDDIMAAGKRMYEEMSPETGEFINFMYDNELLDLVAKEGKAVGGYCTEFPEYKSPFIFSNFNGTSGDVDVLTHEAGHAFAAYTVRNFEFLENSQPTMESCECHSMAMEFLEKQSSI